MRATRSCWVAASRAVTGSVLAHRTDAVGTLRLLAGRVGTDGRAGDDAAGIHRHLTAFDGHAEAVEAARGGAALLLAHPVVLASVARALEPLRRLAPRHATAQVDALLVDGHQTRFVALEDGAVGGDLLGR